MKRLPSLLLSRGPKKWPKPRQLQLLLLMLQQLLPRLLRLWLALSGSLAMVPTEELCLRMPAPATAATAQKQAAAPTVHHETYPPWVAWSF